MLSSTPSPENSLRQTRIALDEALQNNDLDRSKEIIKELKQLVSDLSTETHLLGRLSQQVMDIEGGILPGKICEVLLLLDRPAIEALKQVPGFVEKLTLLTSTVPRDTSNASEVLANMASDLVRAQFALGESDHALVDSVSKSSSAMPELSQLFGPVIDLSGLGGDIFGSRKGRYTPKRTKDDDVSNWGRKIANIEYGSNQDQASKFTRALNLLEAFEDKRSIPDYRGFIALNLKLLIQSAPSNEIKTKYSYELVEHGLLHYDSTSSELAESILAASKGLADCGLHEEATVLSRFAVLILHANKDTLISYLNDHDTWATLLDSDAAPKSTSHGIKLLRDVSAKHLELL